MENTNYTLCWERISDVIKEIKIVINAIVTPMISIDWCIKTSSQQKNELYTCQFFLACFYSNSSTVQGNCITTTEHISLPSNLSTCAVQNRGEWTNEWVINWLAEEIMDRVKFYFNFGFMIIWFRLILLLIHFRHQNQILIRQK